MGRAISEKQKKRLLNYRTKNQMTPTFFSGVFLSCAINILTTEESRTRPFEMVSMFLMFVSCALFFMEASKTHELQDWWHNEQKENMRKDDAYFLNKTTIWGLGKYKNFYKYTLPLFPVVAWIAGLLSLPIYFFSTDIANLLRCIIK